MHYCNTLYNKLYNAINSHLREQYSEQVHCESISYFIIDKLFYCTFFKDLIICHVLGMVFHMCS